MDPELKALVKENLELTRETHDLVKKMHSAQKWGRFFRILYWVILIGISVGAFYFLQGPLMQLIDTYQGLLGGIEKAQQGINSIPDMTSARELLDRLRP